MSRSAPVLAVLLGLAAALPAAAQPTGREVGEVVRASGDVFGTPAAGSRGPLTVADPVLLDMLVETGADSEAMMTFIPRGSVALGSDADIRLTRVEVDRLTGRSRSFLEVLLGRLRLVLTPGSGDEAEIDTPTSTLGVRGTDVRVEVLASGLTRVEVVEGTVEVRAKAGGPALDLEAGFVSVVAPGRRATQPAPRSPEPGPPETEEPLPDPPFPPGVSDRPVGRQPG